MDFDKIESLAQEFITEHINRDAKAWGGTTAEDYRKFSARALEVTLLCLRLYHEQFQAPQCGGNNQP
jgi:hypothetical protein